MHQGLSTSGSKLQARQHCKHHKQQLSTIEWSDFKKVHNNNDESILLSYSTIIKTRACREQLVIRVEQFQKGSLTVILFTLVTMHHIRGLIGNNTTIISFPWNEGSLSAYISESSKKFICRTLSPNKPFQELHWRIKSLFLGCPFNLIGSEPNVKINIIFFQIKCHISTIQRRDVSSSARHIRPICWGGWC